MIIFNGKENHLKNLFASGPSISEGHFVKKWLSFSYRFRYRSKRETFLENGMNQGLLERRPVVIVNACMKAGKYKTLNGRLEQWRDKKSIQIQLVTTYCSNTCLDTKLFAIIRNKEIGQDQECQHTFAHLPLCELVMTYTPQLRA